MKKPQRRNASFAGSRATPQTRSSIRSLAESTQVNKLTVIEAYNVLEADGLVEARQGSGYFVSPATIRCPQSGSCFAPPQDVIVSEQPPPPPPIEEVKGGSFFNLYMASV